MTSYQRTIKPLAALASESRLQILEYVKRGVNNPVDIAKAVKLDLGTVRQHLRILSEAGIIERIPLVTQGGRLTVNFRVRHDAKDALLTLIQDVFKNA